MDALDLLKQIRFTGPNEDGEYWLHIRDGEYGGGVDLGMVRPRTAIQIDKWERARSRIVKEARQD